MAYEQLAQDMQDVLAVELTIHMDGQALSAELIDDREHSERLAVVGAVLDEVVGPDMVPVRRAQSDAGPIIEPQTAPLGLFSWHFQPLTPPDALHAVQAHIPTVLFQQPVDAPVAVPAVLAGQVNNGRGESVFVRTALGKLALCRSMLAKSTAGSTLRDCQLVHDMINTAPAT